ncbi:hypothetical protein SUGI_0531810 [Cryptomeria japonica]|uniref:chaperone protein dnaJ 20, chloroplastic n=1 Tax=Cryptomeria japonica TaxID=3369 RepID=UPI002408C31D|nr:chaperone protein dnaJ 20, chloroplastic [Cryptomeria japonica]GLJ27121.1 hypothetical protein SUGI_0531810 [Cryptomeria japonica]
MECNASIGAFHGINLMPKTASAGISHVRIGGTPKQSACKLLTTIKASQSQCPASSSYSLYQVLSVPENVSASDLKRAYRRMALKYHPDVCPAAEKEECSKLFLQVQEAYETLSDPLVRQDYDWRLRNGMETNERGGRLESCNYAWEAQLMELIKRRPGNNSSSWGSRMRRRNQQEAAPAS